MSDTSLLCETQYTQNQKGAGLVNRLRQAGQRLRKVDRFMESLARLLFSLPTTRGDCRKHQEPDTPLQVPGRRLTPARSLAGGERDVILKLPGDRKLIK